VLAEALQSGGDVHVVVHQLMKLMNIILIEIDLYA
jgi:hypothetical protein